MSRYAERTEASAPPALCNRPADLPHMRDVLLDFSRSAVGAGFREFLVEEQTLTPAAAEVVRAGFPGLAEAALFWADDGMCELATVAARTLPEFTLDVDDPPCPAGLLWFATPVADIESTNERMPFWCVAVGWQVTASRLWLTTYVDRDTFPGGDRFGLDADRIAAKGFPAVFPLGIWPTPIGDGGAAEPVDTEVGWSILSTLKTVWLLMRQPLAAVEDAELDRTVLRRYRKRGVEPPAVRVIGMRRRESSAAGGVSAREWRHRWVVRGHWRSQAWGPGRQRRRPVWVSPFVKGPEGAPMLGGEKVYRVAADPSESVDQEIQGRTA